MAIVRQQYNKVFYPIAHKHSNLWTVRHTVTVTMRHTVTTATAENMKTANPPAVSHGRNTESHQFDIKAGRHKVISN